MRKVLITTYETEDGFMRYHQRNPNNGPAWKVIEREGFFHQFASEGEDGSISVMAIIEFTDGSVETVYPANMKFVSPVGVFP